MNKNQKKIVVLAVATSLAVASVSCEHIYAPNIELFNKDSKAYGKYSKGNVYIGSAEFLEGLTGLSDCDILVLDERDAEDPNFKIFNSCKITSREERNEILEILMKYEEEFPSNWDRTIESLRLEWFAHNFFHFFNYNLDSTTDVDLNNKDEEVYNKDILRRILRL